MPPASSHATLRETLNDFLEDDAGVPFGQLADFAEPLFELYQVDLRAGVASVQNDARTDELASLVAVLETARLLWIFLGMYAPARRERMEALGRILIGPEAGPAEKQDFRELLANLKARRNQLVDPDNDETSPATFDDLLEGFAERNNTTHVTGDTYGPNALPQDEARALFAQPLLETKEVLQNPSQMQEALERAQTYWELAQGTSDEHQKQLANLKNRFASSEEEERQIEREAHEMLNRFDQLFPDH